VAVPEVTAKQLHGWFAGSIKRRPVPDLDLCRELAEAINRHRATLDRIIARRRAGVRNNVDQVVIYARLLRSLSRRIPPDELNVLVPPWPDAVEKLDRTLTSFLEPFPHRRQSGATKSRLWLMCSRLFTPHIVATLDRAGWPSISTTNPTSPVIAVLAELIGVVTGDEPPDHASLGSTLRQAAGKGRKETR
jgi:hypothetical protein